MTHLISLRVQHRQTLAIDAADLASARHLLGETMRANDVLVHAYGLDEERVELVATPPAADALSRAMQGFARRHAAAFNRRHGRHGSLWAGRFAAAAIEAQPWLLRAMLRTEQSEAGGRRSSSSADHHSGLIADSLVSDAPEYWALGNTPFERQQRYRAALAEPLVSDWRRQMDAALRGGWPLGSAGFVAALQEQSARSLERRSRGRPARNPAPG